MGEQQKRKGFGLKSVLVSILVPILCIIMICHSFFKILDEMIEILDSVVIEINKAVLDFLKDPISGLARRMGKIYKLD